MAGNTVSRRKFLGLGAAAVGGATTVPLRSALDTLGVTSGALQIGVMLPQAQLHPLLAANLLDGLKLAFAENHRAVSFLTEQIRGDRASAVEAAEALLGAGVNVVVAMLGSLHVEALQPLFAAHDATLIVTTAGENAIEGRLDNVVYNSLHYWQSAYAAGQWAVGRYGATGMLLASFYESGFDSVFAFDLGVQSAGGRVAASRITHLKPSDNEIAQAIAAIRDVNPDFVYTAYQGQQAAEFLRAYHAAGLETPLVGAAFMAEELSLGSFNTVCAWSSDVATAENAAFLRAFSKTTGRRADAFGLLGYETGLWIGAALPGAFSPRGLRDALKTSAFVSPRGRVAFDAESQTLTGGLFLRELGMNRRIAAEIAVASPKLSLDVKTGWVHSYLSV